jgi:K+-sensing histidine kinase KdpD
MAVMPSNTLFAPAARTSREELESQVKLVVNAPVTQILLNNIGVFLMVLNENRQIVAANHDFLTTLGFSSAEEFMGLRPGEALDCVNSAKQPGGCGTDENCRYCGAVCALLESQTKSETVVSECRLIAGGKNPASYDFRIHATTLVLENRRFTVLALHDIGEEKRRQVIERVFFHDVRNTLNGISGWSDILALGGNEREIDNIAARIRLLVSRLVEDIESHQILLDAEKNNLSVEFVEENISVLFQALEAFIAHHDCAADKTFSHNLGGLGQRAIETSKSLLLRVLFNMMVNAFEATPPGENVELAAREHDGECLFSVHNLKVMSPEAKAQLFQRGFSTKSNKGRGFGTYSMKLLGEKFLGGKVWFVSLPGEGTTFFLQLPWRAEAAKRKA